MDLAKSWTFLACMKNGERWITESYRGIMSQYGAMDLRTAVYALQNHSFLRRPASAVTRQLGLHCPCRENEMPAHRSHVLEAVPRLVSDITLDEAPSASKQAIANIAYQVPWLRVFGDAESRVTSMPNGVRRFARTSWWGGVEGLLAVPQLHSNQRLGASRSNIPSRPPRPRPK